MEKISTGLCIACAAFGAFFLFFSADYNLVAEGDWLTGAIFAAPFLVASAAGLLVLWRVRALRSHEYVSPSRRRACIAVSIVMVVLTAGLAPFILYASTLGFAPQHLSIPSATLVQDPIAGGARLAIGSIDMHVFWWDISVLVSDGANVSKWNISADGWAVIGLETRYHGGASQLGDVTVWMNITDLSTDMYIRSDDFFTVTTGGPSQWDPHTEYVFYLCWEPTMTEMARASLHF